MKESTIFLIIFLLAILSSPLPAAENGDADRVLARHFGAVGGVEELKKIENLSVKVTFKAFNYTYTTTFARGGAFRVEADGNITIFDGSSYWRSFHGLSGTLHPDEVAEYENYSLLETFLAGLLGADGNPLTLEYKGIEKKHGNTYEVLTSGGSGGRVSTFYFNAGTGLLEKKVELVDDEEFKQLKNIYYYRDYASVGPVKLFTEAEAVCITNGEQILPLSSFSDFRLNAPLEEDYFRKPERTAPPATFENDALAGVVIGMSARGSAIVNITEADLQKLGVEDGTHLKIKIKDNVTTHKFYEDIYAAPSLGPGDYLATFSRTPALWTVKAYMGMTSDQPISEGDPVTISLVAEQETD